LSSRPGAGKILLLALSLGIGLPLAAYPRGSIEKQDRARLAQAEQLIAERKYNQAILALRDLLQANPDLFDAAEVLMEKIREARAQYNAKFEELIKALFEENNVPKGLALIAELEELDPYPNEAVARALEQAKVGRELVVNMNRFNRLMDEAAALLAQGSYAEANARYLEGFVLGRQSFDQAEYGNILKNSVLGSLDSLQSAAQSFPATLERLEAAEGAMQVALQGALSPASIAALQSEIGQLSVAARELGELDGTARSAGQNFQAQGRQIGERPAGRGYDSFLFFGAQLVLGRSGKPREGIAAVFAMAREAAVSRQKQALLRAADALWQEGLEEYRSGRYPLERLPAAASLYAASLRLFSLWALGLQAPLTQAAPDSLGREAAEYLLVRERIRAARGYEELAGISQAFAPWKTGVLPAPEAIQPARQTLAGLRRRAAVVEEAGGGGAAALGAQAQASGFALNGAAEQDLALQEAARAMRGQVEDVDLRLLASFAGSSLERLAGLDASYRTRYREGLGLQQGVQTPSRLERYPDRALAVYNRLSAELAVAAQQAGRLAEEIAGEPAYLAASASLQESAQGLAALREGLAGLQAELAASAGSAQAAALQAGRYRQEGQLREQEARRNLSPLREAAAREGLRNAQEAFDRSLEFQEDPEVRRMRDETLPQLAARIDQLVNEKVISDVRALITDGRNRFRLGDYNSAEQVFLRARARWSDTHPEENPEVALWLDWTRSAIQNIAGRQIALSNPLYPQMSQLFNLAFQEYQSARELVEARRVQEAILLLDKAMERLEQIRVLFPYNSEMQFLMLRIEQLKDPEGFRNILDARFRAALDKRGDKPQEALGELEVIRLLTPSYPGLQNAIGSLRITLGLDLAPPDPAKRERARRLYGEALAIYNDRNRRSQLPVALERLNEAIALDSDFLDALTLKDRVQILVGGSRQQFLSSDDQRRYKEAEGYFLGGQLTAANAIVQQLWANQRNRGYPPLIDLKAKIEARL
jgi:hypothetical protein